MVMPMLYSSVGINHNEDIPLSIRQSNMNEYITNPEYAHELILARQDDMKKLISYFQTTLENRYTITERAIKNLRKKLILENPDRLTARTLVNISNEADDRFNLWQGRFFSLWRGMIRELAKRI
jgi:hypothetical protein